MKSPSPLHTSLGPVHLIEMAIQRKEGCLDLHGALVVTTDNMFIDANEAETTDDQHWTLIRCTRFICAPQRDGTNSDAALMIDLTNRRVLVAGLRYTGEIKKAMFSVQNYLLSEKNVLPMHCSANVGEQWPYVGGEEQTK